MMDNFGDQQPRSLPSKTNVSNAHHPANMNAGAPDSLAPSTGPILKLPPELLLLITSFLPVSNKIAFSLACRQIYYQATDNTAWDKVARLDVLGGLAGNRDRAEVAILLDKDDPDPANELCGNCFWVHRMSRPSTVPDWQVNGAQSWQAQIYEHVLARLGWHADISRHEGADSNIPDCEGYHHHGGLKWWNIWKLSFRDFYLVMRAHRRGDPHFGRPVESLRIETDWHLRQDPRIENRMGNRVGMDQAAQFVKLETHAQIARDKLIFQTKQHLWAPFNIMEWAKSDRTSERLLNSFKFGSGPPLTGLRITRDTGMVVCDHIDLDLHANELLDRLGNRCRKSEPRKQPLQQSDSPLHHSSNRQRVPKGPYYSERDTGRCSRCHTQYEITMHVLDTDGFEIVLNTWHGFGECLIDCDYTGWGACWSRSLAGRGSADLYERTGLRPWVAPPRHNRSPFDLEVGSSATTHHSSSQVIEYWQDWELGMPSEDMF